MTTQRRSRLLGPIAGLAALLLLAGACGARLDDEQRAAIATQGVASGGTTTGGQDPTATTAAGTAAPGAPATTAPGGAAPAAGAGASAPPSGADGGGAPSAPEAVGGGGGGAAPCAGGGASDVGVTDTEILLGNVSTLSGPVPGFGQTGINGAQAYINWKNSTGGVCGRALKLVTADDRLDAGVNRSETARMVDEVFAFLGSTSIVDDGGTGPIVEAGVPDLTLAVSDQRMQAPTNFSPSPNDLASGGNNAETAFRYFNQTRGVTTAAIVSPSQATARAKAQGFKTDLERAGIQVVYQQEVPVAETNYSGVANGIKNAGADLLLTTLDVTGMAQLARAVDRAGYEPEVPFYGVQVWGDKFLELAGDAAEGVTVGLPFSIAADASRNEMMSNFVTWYERTNPGAGMDFFALQSWVAADMLVTALEQTGQPPSRQKLLEVLGTFTSYDASGMIAAVNPAQKKGPTCFVVAVVQGGQWTRAEPAEGFQC